jgi:hemerythrin-like domain-containing protein
MTTELEGTGAITRRFVEREHRELAAGVARIEDAAAAMEPATAHEASHRVRAALDWFAQQFEQHLAWEDGWLYPHLDRIGGSAWVTRLMRFEHDQIRGAFKELEAEWETLGPAPDRPRLAAVRRRLYGLACVIRGHMERESWVLEPLLGEG